MFTMSPSWTSVLSGIPWQITSLTLVHSDFGKPLVAERRGVGAVVAQELVADPVELVGGHARDDVGAHEVARLGSDPAGDAHPFDGVGCPSPRSR